MGAIQAACVFDIPVTTGQLGVLTDGSDPPNDPPYYRCDEGALAYTVQQPGGAERNQPSTELLLLYPSVKHFEH